MASLTVRLGLADPASDALWHAAVIEVRDFRTFVVKARGLSDQALPVNPGRYLVTATLPDGQQAGSGDLVEVAADEDQEVVLALDDVEIPKSLQSRTPWSDAIKQYAQPLAGLFVPPRVTLVSGDPFARWLKPGTNMPPLGRRPEARSTFEVTFDKKPALLEVATSPDRYDYFAIPVELDGKTTVQLDATTGVPALKLDFNGPLTAFFDYVQAGFASQAKSMSRLQLQEAEAALGQGKGSPVRAALAVYVLLRANEIEALDRATAVLFEAYPWLPDALPLRLEYLARVARHDEARDLLLQLPAWGMPWFRSGVVYAAKRAACYAAVADAGSRNPSAESRTLLTYLAKRLGEIAESLSQNSMTTVFRGLPRLT